MLKNIALWTAHRWRKTEESVWGEKQNIKNYFVLSKCSVMNVNYIVINCIVICYSVSYYLYFGYANFSYTFFSCEFINFQSIVRNICHCNPKTVGEKWQSLYWGTNPCHFCKLISTVCMNLVFSSTSPKCNPCEYRGFAVYDFKVLQWETTVKFSWVVSYVNMECILIWVVAVTDTSIGVWCGHWHAYRLYC
jgi:hypothetical protein